MLSYIIIFYLDFCWLLWLVISYLIERFCSLSSKHLPKCKNWTTQCFLCMCWYVWSSVWISRINNWASGSSLLDDLHWDHIPFYIQFWSEIIWYHLIKYHNLLLYSVCGYVPGPQIQPEKHMTGNWPRSQYHLLFIVHPISV